METTAFRASAPRLPGLDLIRAAAIAWVMLTHGELFGLTSNDHWLVRYGWFGVDLFFVLSGYLVAGQLLRPFARGERPNYARFWATVLGYPFLSFSVVLIVMAAATPSSLIGRHRVPGARQRVRVNALTG